MGIVEEAESCSARKRKLRTGKQKTRNQRSVQSRAAAEREKPETANNSLVLSKVNKSELCQNDAKYSGLVHITVKYCTAAGVYPDSVLVPAGGRPRHHRLPPPGAALLLFRSHLPCGRPWRGGW